LVELVERTLTRFEFYELVWSEPIRNLSPRVNISDVALSKICRKHDIPRPPRGYWAKLTAGKSATRASLPGRGLGMPQVIDLDRRNRWHYSITDDLEQIEIPPPPEFSVPVEQLEVWVRKQVGKVTVARDLREGHHLIRRLLEQDDERREARKKRSYHSSFDEPLFESPFERRRLRLINAIFLRLGRCGVTARFRGKDPDQFDIRLESSI